MPHVRPHPFSVVLALALIAGCSSNANGPVVVPVAGSTSPSKAPSSAPSGSAVPTMTPTPVATGGIGTLACTGAGATLPGNYFSLFTSGVSTGDPAGFAQDPALGGTWSYDQYAVATPAPTIAPTASAAPTATPTAFPTATATPLQYSVFVGTFTVGGFGGTSPIAYTVPAQNGCFFLEIVQPVGGTIAQFRDRPNVSGTPNAADNAEGFGSPNISESASYNVTNIASGAVTQFTLSNLSVSAGTGSGTFTLDTGATGTVTLQSAANQTFALPASLRAAFARSQTLRTRLERR